jgi:hypothetical protein
MSFIYSVICFFICTVAVGRLNTLGPETAYLRRIVLVLLAVGALGGALRPLSPDLISGLSDVMFAGGVLTSMVVRYYRPRWYADRPFSRGTWIERVLARGRE